MAKCDKCGSEDVFVVTHKNGQEMCNEYFVVCNNCGICVKFKGERWI